MRSDLQDGVSARWDDDYGIVLMSRGETVVLSPVAWANLLTFLQQHQNPTARKLYELAQEVMR